MRNDWSEEERTITVIKERRAGRSFKVRDGIKRERTQKKKIN